MTSADLPDPKESVSYLPNQFSPFANTYILFSKGLNYYAGEKKLPTQNDSASVVPVWLRLFLWRANASHCALTGQRSHVGRAAELFLLGLCSKGLHHQEPSKQFLAVEQGASKRSTNSIVDKDNNLNGFGPKNKQTNNNNRKWQDMEDKEIVQISNYISVEDTGKVQNFHFVVCLLHTGMFFF